MCGTSGRSPSASRALANDPLAADGWTAIRGTRRHRTSGAATSLRTAFYKDDSMFAATPPLSLIHI
eukprot:5564962-Alexandrium_andersonii.AAC.1